MYLQNYNPFGNVFLSTLAAAVPSVLSAAESERVVAQAKAAYFPERSFAAVVAAAPPERRARLARFVA